MDGYITLLARTMTREGWRGIRTLLQDVLGPGRAHEYEPMHERCHGSSERSFPLAEINRGTWADAGPRGQEGRHTNPVRYGYLRRRPRTAHLLWRPVETLGYRKLVGRVTSWNYFFDCLEPPIHILP